MNHRVVWAAWLCVAASIPAGCARHGNAAENSLYALPPDQALARLRAADIKGFRDARQCGMLISFSSAEPAPGTLVWRVESEGVPVARFTMHVAADGHGSRITFDVPKAPKGGEIYDGTQVYTHPALMQPLRPALRELVDAAIARRPFDWHRLPDPINTDGACGSMRQNLEASGVTYSINDPAGMTHDQAEKARADGAILPVEHDTIFADTGASPWSQ